MITYRALKTNEAEEAFLIENENLSTAWSVDQIKNLPDYATYIGAFDGENLCGIGSMYNIAGDAQILNLAVDKKYRKQGIGFKIMQALIDTAKGSGAETITLEVAQDNYSAISLYEKCGFSAVGIRKGFYAGKDAVAMLLEVLK